MTPVLPGVGTLSWRWGSLKAAGAGGGVPKGGAQGQNCRIPERWRFAPPQPRTGGGPPLGGGTGLLPTVHLAGTGAEKSGVCPAVEVDMNCTQECLSDADCADNLKCCKAGCVTICQMPNGNPRGPAPGGAVQRRLGGGGSAQFPSGNRGATHPRVPGRVEVDGSRSACALPPMASVRSRC